jgi:DNA-directed RNA polymerase specialized sigma24 family protein
MATMGVVEKGSSPAREPTSFEHFYRAHHTAMVRLAYLLTGSRVIAEELVQDSFLRLQPRWGALDVPAAYLRRTVTNASYSYLRRRRREEAYVAERPVAATAPEIDEMWAALARLAPGAARSWCCGSISTSPKRRSPRRWAAGRAP